MTSVISSRPNVALLVHSLSETEPANRSYSKRLYTFIHYEHSTHPRRWIILFFLILFISISLAWIIAGLIRLRASASYLKSCSEGKIQCASGTSLICSLSSSLCLCPEETYWDERRQKCLTVKSIHQSCSTHQQCDTDKGLICHTNSTCQCSPNTYFTNTGCKVYLLYGAACLASSALECNTPLGLICDTFSQRCVCSPLTYWSSARCEPLGTYADYCDQNRTCNAQLGLFCRLPGPYPACDCPLPSKLYTCDCQSGQTWARTTTINNGTSACINQLPYLDKCTSNSQCSQSLHLTCINGTCDCAVPLWFWSHTANRCLPCESQGDVLIRYSSQWVCTQLINSYLLTYNASQSACTSIGWSLISPIFGSDIPAIARTYPTYRLWVNIQTSPGNSTYINYRFPNNQSNWNMYVSSSLAADYFSYIYALQIISSYDKTMLFGGNTHIDTGHIVCAFY